VTQAGDITEDRLLGGRLIVRQPREGFRIAIDTVFLAAAVPVRAGEKVLDLGCGVGGAALCLLAREPEAQVTGLDLQRALVTLAGENAKANGFEGRFSAMVGDVRSAPPRIGPGGFDHVLANPPYLEQGKATASPKELRRVADMEGEARLADWLQAAITFARDGGSVTFIQRADRLQGLLAGLEGTCGDLVVFPLWAGPGKPARRVLVQAVKQSRKPMTLASGLLLHAEGGGYTAEAEAVLREAAALRLRPA
jgi:tRNA1(Val) A37 N6-methylase TrmN6